MVKLDRIDQPIFAGNNVSADDNVAVFGSMKTSPSYTMDLPTLLASADYQKGWQNAVAVGYAPFLEEMNGVQYGITYQLAYLQQQGIPEWTGTTTYYKGSLAKLNTASGCQLYASKIDNNTGNLLTDTNSWQLVFDSSVTYAKDSDVVKLTGDQNIGGAKYFTDGIIRKTSSQSSQAAFSHQNTAITKGTIPNTITESRWYLTDENGSFGQAYSIGGMRVAYNTTGSTEAMLTAFKPEANSTAQEKISITYPTSGDAYTYAPTPLTSDNSTKIATTAYVNSKLSPNVSSRVTITSSIGTSNGYTAPSNGFITVESTTKEATVKLIIGDYIVAQAYNYQGDSHGNQQTFLCCPIGRGQTVRYTRNSTAVDPALAYFIPYA